jgi:hypothetical protein
MPIIERQDIGVSKSPDGVRRIRKNPQSKGDRQCMPAILLIVALNEAVENAGGQIAL